MINEYLWRCAAPFGWTGALAIDTGEIDEEGHTVYRPAKPVLEGLEVYAVEEGYTALYKAPVSEHESSVPFGWAQVPGSKPALLKWEGPYEAYFSVPVRPTADWPSARVGRIALTLLDRLRDQSKTSPPWGELTCVAGARAQGDDMPLSPETKRLARDAVRLPLHYAGSWHWDLADGGPERFDPADTAIALIALSLSADTPSDEHAIDRLIAASGWIARIGASNPDLAAALDCRRSIENWCA